MVWTINKTWNIINVTVCSQSYYICYENKRDRLGSNISSECHFINYLIFDYKFNVILKTP